MTIRSVMLRHNIEKVLEAYGYIMGSVPLELLAYHVNNKDKFSDTGFSEEEILKELEYMENIKKIERVTSYRMYEEVKIKGDKKQWKC